MTKIINGVYAAIITPRKQNGGLDEKSLRKLIEFLLEKGIRGFAINGATGEYCVTTRAELRRILQVAKEVINGSADYVVGIGSAGIHGCIENGRVAKEYGATAVLLPMPHFFPYEQEDLKAFCIEVAANLPLNILLYNLPQFTTGLESGTVKALIQNCQNIIGIKDSGGSLEILRHLTKNKISTCRIVGNDSVLADSLSEDVSDGVISGVAGVLPELILSLYKSGKETDSEKFSHSVTLLNEFISHLNNIPTPWGLKIVLENRGIVQSAFSQPLSDHRKEQLNSIKEWFKKWEQANSITDIDQRIIENPIIKI